MNRYVDSSSSSSRKFAQNQAKDFGIDRNGRVEGSLESANPIDEPRAAGLHDRKGTTSTATAALLHSRSRSSSSSSSRSSIQLSTVEEKWSNFDRAAEKKTKKTKTRKYEAEVKERLEPGRFEVLLFSGP